MASIIKDMYSPYIQDTNWVDKISDKIFGTNKVANANMLNNYELQKAVNINKYNWNKEGMLMSGINPLVGSGNLSGVSSSQASSMQNGDPGYLAGSFLELADMLNPVKVIKEVKNTVKDLLDIF